MKKLILWLALLCSLSVIYSCQDDDTALAPSRTPDIVETNQHLSFLEDGKMWFHTQSNGRQIDTFYVEGDTIVRGKKCMKVYNIQYYPKKGTRYVSRAIPLYEEGGKVYLAGDGRMNYTTYAISGFSGDAVYDGYKNAGENDYLLYDFNAKVGDTLTVYNPRAIDDDNEYQVDIFMYGSPMVIIKDTVIDLLNVKRRCLQVKGAVSDYHSRMIEEGLTVNPDGYASEAVWWIEGIGSESGPFLPWSYTGSFKGKATYNYSLECVVGTDTIFDYLPFVSIMHPQLNYE